MKGASNELSYLPLTEQKKGKEGWWWKRLKAVSWIIEEVFEKFSTILPTWRSHPCRDVCAPSKGKLIYHSLLSWDQLPLWVMLFARQQLEWYWRWPSAQWTLTVQEARCKSGLYEILYLACSHLTLDLSFTVLNCMKSVPTSHKSVHSFEVAINNHC